MIKIACISYGPNDTKVAIRLNGIQIELPCKDHESTMILADCLNETLKKGK